MTGIIGPFQSVVSSMDPLDGHVAHLRHLANAREAEVLLRSRHRMVSARARQIAPALGAHIEQGLAFHQHSRSAPLRIRPVLQYYSWLNLAVACVLAYRPPNSDKNLRKHGVRDLSPRLTKLNLRSEVVEVTHGVVPLFHAIISGAGISGRKFRLSHLASAIPMVAHELDVVFGRQTQVIFVRERVREAPDGWRSEIAFSCKNTSGSDGRLTPDRLKRAMPILRNAYSIVRESPSRVTCLSKASWKTRQEADRCHQSRCRQMVNYGGHSLQPDTVHTQYCWRSVSRIPLLPTLTASLLLSFSLASIARYRPVLGVRTGVSSLNLLIDVFVQESDATVIPALRNLLKREEVSISPAPGI